MRFRPLKPHQRSRIGASKRTTTAVSGALDEAPKLALLLAKVLFAFGFAITYIYCSKITFFPSGMTLGDGVGLFFIALGFGAKESIILLISASAALFPLFLIGRISRGIRRFLKKTPESRRSHASSYSTPQKALSNFVLDWGVGSFSLVCAAFIGIMIAMTYTNEGRDKAAAFAQEFIISGGLFFILTATAWMLFHSYSGRAPKWLIITSLLIGAYALPMLFARSIRDKVFDSTFSEIALRTPRENALLEVSSANDALIRAVAQRHGIPYASCDIAGSSSKLVSGIDVDWHGIGTRSLLRLPAANQISAGPTVEVDAAGLRVTRTTAMAAERCMTLSTDLLFFDSNSSELRAQAVPALEETASQLAYMGNQLAIEAATRNAKLPEKKRTDLQLKLRVVGHADPMPRKAGSNYELSLARADAVNQWMQKRFSAQDWKYESTGKGSLEPKTQCPSTAAPELQRECYASSRRVELRVTLLPKPKRP